MQITPEVFLPIAEKAKSLAFVDIEASNLKADFGTVVVVSIKPYKGKTKTFFAKPGNDKRLMQEVREELNKYPVWVTFYGKLFDVPFMNSRLLVHGMPPLDKKHHIDLYWVIKGQTALSRRNQGHLLSWLESKQSKMSVSPNVWANMAQSDTALPTLVKRCESDVAGLQSLYDKTKHLIREITR